jgi:hypothetical protein
MADNTDMEVMTVLPKELRLGAPPTMPQARSYLFRQQSSLSSYNPDEQIQINIPRLQRSYLSKDSYLEFRLNGEFKSGTLAAQNGQDQYVPDLFLDDAGAWGLFERMEVFDYLGSTVLESTDSLPQLMSLLIDMGGEFTDPENEGAAVHGLCPSYTASSQNDNSTYFTIPPLNAVGNKTGTVAAAAGKFNGTTYTFPGGTYATQTAFTTAFEDWFTTTVTAATGITIEPSTLFTNAYEFSSDKSFTFESTSTGISTLTGHGAVLYTATDNGKEVVSINGVGKKFYCGGMPLATFGTTRTISSQAFSYTFAIPLPSFLGFLSKKMVPLHNGFTIVLTIASKFKPMFMAPKQVPVLIAAASVSDTANLRRNVLMDAINTIEPSPQASTSSVTNINRPDLLADPATFWWNITDVNMVCQILELGPVAESMILSSSQGQPLIVHSKQLRNYRGNVGKSNAEFSLPLNLNVASLTNILWFFRPDGTENSLKYPSVGGRYRNALQRWEFQYGSTVLPQSQGITCMHLSGPNVPSGTTSPFTSNQLLVSQLNGFSECYNELLKARPNIPSKGRLSYASYVPWWYNGFLQWGEYGTTPWRCINSATGDSYGMGETPKFACGLNTELVTGKSGDLICGLNTNGMNTSIRGYIHPTYTNISLYRLDCTIDAYAEYDAFINISPGIATTVSF